MMTDSQDSSVLCSLQELMAIEEQRVADEATARATERARRRAAEDAQRAAEAARRRAAEEARLAREREEERRRRDEAARMDGLRQAEIERARLDAQRAIRLEELARHQEHERRLLAIQQDKRTRQLRSALIASCSGFVLFLATGLVFVNHDAQRRDADVAQLRAEIREKERALAQRTAHLEDAHLSAEGRWESQREAQPAARSEGEQEGSHEAGTGSQAVEGPRRAPATGDALRQRPSPSPRRPPPRRDRETPPGPTCPHGDPMCGEL